MRCKGSPRSGGGRAASDFSITHIFLINKGGSFFRLCPAGHQHKRGKNQRQERLQRAGTRPDGGRGAGGRLQAWGLGGGQCRTSVLERKGVQHPDCPAGAPLAGRHRGQGPECEQDVLSEDTASAPRGVFRTRRRRATLGAVFRPPRCSPPPALPVRTQSQTLGVNPSLSRGARQTNEPRTVSCGRDGPPGTPRERPEV